MKSRFILGDFHFYFSYFSLLRTSWDRPIQFIFKIYWCFFRFLPFTRSMHHWLETLERERVFLFYYFFFRCKTIEVSGEIVFRVFVCVSMYLLSQWYSSHCSYLFMKNVFLSEPASIQGFYYYPFFYINEHDWLI